MRVSACFPATFNNNLNTQSANLMKHCRVLQMALEALTSCGPQRLFGVFLLQLNLGLKLLHGHNMTTFKWEDAASTLLKGKL